MTYLPRINYYLDSIPIKKMEDFEKVQIGLQILLKGERKLSTEDKVKIGSRAIKREIQKIAKILNQPNIQTPMIYDEFRAVFTNRIIEKIAGISNLTLKEKKKFLKRNPFAEIPTPQPIRNFMQDELDEENRKEKREFNERIFSQRHRIFETREDLGFDPSDFKEFNTAYKLTQSYKIERAKAKTFSDDDKNRFEFLSKLDYIKQANKTEENKALDQPFEEKE